MNILFFSGHPAQVHNFRHLKIELDKRGHQTFWLASDKDVSKYLLDCYKITYTIIPRPDKSLLSKALTFVKNTILVIRFIKNKNIKIAFSRICPYVAIACWLLRKTHLTLADTETAKLYDKYFVRFVSVLFTAKSFNINLRKDQIRYNGNIELFYLHPNRFHPVEDISSLLQVKRREPYIIIRFVKWDAFHDKELKGFTCENKIKSVNAFTKYARVFITSEGKLPESLEPYNLTISPEKMHDILAHATMFFGESGTMASESAVLGTPAIYLDKYGRGYTDEEERYGLVFNFKNDESDQIKAIEKGIELLRDKNLKRKTQENRKRFLDNKIDPTALFVWFIEHYPESFKIMKENPDFQHNFK